MIKTKKSLYPDGIFESDSRLSGVRAYRVCIIDPNCQKRFDAVFYINCYDGIVTCRHEAERRVKDEMRERIVKKYIDETCFGSLKDVLKDNWDNVWNQLEKRGCVIEIN